MDTPISFLDSNTAWRLAGWSLTMFLLYIIVRLVYPIIFPTVIAYPWPEKRKDSHYQEVRDGNRTAVLAGSYNPPHLGHLAMLTYLAQRYGQVIAVVGFNPAKKYKVSPEDRIKLLQKMLSATPATRNVRAILVSGYIWRHVKKLEANNETVGSTSIFFRGIRSWKKDGKEERSLQILNTWGPMLLGPLVWPLPTYYLEGDPKYNHVSSTLIREICNGRGSETTELLKLVPESIAADVAKLYGQ